MAVTQELEEIADGAYGDNPMVRGLARARLAALAVKSAPIECHGLDSLEQVFFYEQDFYVLSNFSAFRIRWAGKYDFDTSEACYHWLRFSTGDAEKNPDAAVVACNIMTASSAHAAFKLAQGYKDLQRSDWNAVKVGFMREILRTKAHQHEYVQRKLLATGNRELIENSWRDDFWGWGSDRRGQNMLGKLWMEVRDALRLQLSGTHQPDITK
jgi:N-glycosidase YbiA